MNTQSVTRRAEGKDAWSNDSAALILFQAKLVLCTSATAPRQLLLRCPNKLHPCNDALSYCTTTRNAYHGLFKAHVDEEVLDDIRVSTNGNYVLGNKRFKDEI